MFELEPLIKGYRKDVLGILFILFFLNSCDYNTQQLELDSPLDLPSILTVVDSVLIEIPLDIPNPDSEINTFWSHGDNQFSFLSASGTSLMDLNIYNLDLRKWKSIGLNLEGPNSVYSKGAFNLQNDTVIYFPIIGSNILQIDSQGEIIGKYTFSDGGFDNYNSQNKVPNIEWENGKVYFDLTEYYSLSEKSTFDKAFLIGVFDFKTNTLDKIISYPDEFSGNTWSTNDVNRTSLYLENEIFLSFNKSKYIYVYDKGGNFKYKALAGISKVKEATARLNDSKQNAIRQQSNGYYSSLIYDKWRDVFYRLAVYFDTKEQLTSVEDLRNLAFKRTVGIITLNRNLEMIGLDEFKLSSGLSENYFFVTEKGLNLIDYSNQLEDVLVFKTLNSN